MIARFSDSAWRRLTATDFRVLELIAWYRRQYGVAFPSQSKLATRLQVCRETVCRSVRRLQSLGALLVQHRVYRGCDGRWRAHTNVYKVVGLLGAKIRAITHAVTGVTSRSQITKKKKKLDASDLAFVKNEGLRARLLDFARLGGG